MKECTKCREKYPATTEYWHLNKGCVGGLKTICKKCCSQYQKDKKKKIRDNRLTGPTTPEEELKQIEPPKFSNDKTYKVIQRISMAEKQPEEFIGKCIYHDRRLLTLRNDRGITETFLKMDFVTKDYFYKEV